MLTLRRVLAVCFVASVMACGSNSTSADAAVDVLHAQDGGADTGTGMPVDAATDVVQTADGASGTFGACNLTADGPAVATARVFDSAMPVPAATGGTVTDGTYRLTAVRFTVSSPSTAMNARGLWIVAGNTVRSVTEIDQVPIARDYTFTTSGTGIRVTENCGSPGLTVTLQYSASSSEFSIHSPDNVFTYTRVP